jgi:hypothetical protein
MIWRIVQQARMYEVSDRGDVRSLHTGRILRPCTLKRGGYLAVSLWIDGRGKTYTVHQLVATAFHGPRPSARHHAAHRDGDKKNNTAANVQWATKEENEADKRLHGTANIGERNGSARFQPSDILAMRSAFENGTPRAAIMDRFGVEQSHLSRILNRRLWKELEHGHAPGS